MIEISGFISSLVDFILALFNLIFVFISNNFVLILRIIILIFFFLYLYRILKVFSMFSGKTAFVLALGLTAILELFFGLFGYLANIFYGFFLFLGDLLGGIVGILVALIILLIGYYIVRRLTYWLWKREAEREKEKREHEERVGRKAAEMLGRGLIGKKAGAIAAIADKLKTLRGVSPPVKKKK